MYITRYIKIKEDSMRKSISLLILVCMLLCSISVNADNIGNGKSIYRRTEENQAARLLVYDADNLANYITENLYNKPTELLVKEYFKNLPENYNYNANSVVISDEVGEKIKVAKIDDSTHITFYESGMFSISKVEIGKVYDKTTINDLQPRSIPWEEEIKKVSDEFYNVLGIRYVTVSTTCRYRYNGTDLEIIGNPTGSASVNTVVCSLVSKSTSKLPIGNQMDVHTIANIRTKATGREVAAVVGMYLNANGYMGKYSDIGELN